MNLNLHLFLLLYCIVYELYSIIKISLLLNVGKIRGQVYCKITSQSIKVSFEIVAPCILILIMLIYSTYCYSIGNETILTIIVANLFVMLPVVESILKIKNYGVVTTKGIMLNNRFCKWKHIEKYQWINANSIKFFIKWKNGRYYEEIFENIEVSTNMLEGILKKIKDMI